MNYSYQKSNKLKGFKMIVTKLHLYGYILKSPEINECSSSPCQNGGSCIDQVNSHTCICPAGYNGTNCETGMYLQITITDVHDEVMMGSSGLGDWLQVCDVNNVAIRMDLLK